MKQTTPTKKPSKPRAKRKNPAAVALGRRGGLARKRNLSKARASEIGRNAVAARWGKPAAEAGAPSDPPA